MTDIARICGVSRQTVHAALNGKPGVSGETRDRILRIVKEYNYRPNRLASNLHGKPANLVGVTILNIRNPYCSNLVHGIHGVLRDHDLHLMLFETADRDEEEEAVESLMAYQASGVILSSLEGDEDRIRHLKALKRRGTPLVTVGPVKGLETNFVDTENRKAASLAVQHLVNHGHRRIVYLKGPSKIGAACERMFGFIECLMENGLPFGEGTVIPSGETPEDGYRAARSVLELPRDQRPTGFVAFNDILALGVYDAARDLGLEIPRDVSVVGCYDIQPARLLGPPLTTVALPIRTMGAHAAEMLISLMASGRDAGHIVKYFPPTLMERGSVQRADCTSQTVTLSAS